MESIFISDYGMVRDAGFGDFHSNLPVSVTYYNYASKVIGAGLPAGGTDSLSLPDDRGVPVSIKYVYIQNDSGMPIIVGRDTSVEGVANVHVLSGSALWLPLSAFGELRIKNVGLSATTGSIVVHVYG